MPVAFEDQLLLCCCRVELSDAARARAAQLAQRRLDWAYVLSASIEHGIAPLLYRGLQQVEAARQAVPLAVFNRLRQLYEGNVKRSQRLAAVLHEVAAEANRVGMPLLGLKDVYLVREIYPEAGLRPMGDVDLLIRQGDYERMRAALASLGFEPLPDRDIPYTLKYAWAHHFRRTADNVWLDVQWNVMQREWDSCGAGSFRFDPDDMWTRAQPLDFAGARLLAPTLEAMLFHLCLHLEGHQYCELVLFCDIAELLKRRGMEVDWAQVTALTRKYRAESSVYYTLWLTQNLLDAPVPERVLSELKPAYFQANLFEPLFGNLTGLHVALDAIRLTVRPPEAALRQFEYAARQQAVCSQQVFKELKSLAQSFTASGQPLTFEGAPSPRAFPVRSLSPFEAVHGFLLEQDAALLCETLARCGYVPHDGEWLKRIEIHSCDPMLTNRLVRLNVRVQMAEQAEWRQWVQGPEAPSKKALAWQALKTRLPENRSDTVEVVVQFIPLELSDLIAVLSAQLGARQQGQLFGLCSLLDVLGHCTEPIAWQAIAERDPRCRIGLNIAAGFAGCTDEQALDASTEAAPRVLEAARYDPGTWGRYSAFRPGFFAVLSLLSQQGFKARAAYAWRLLVGGHGHGPILPGLMMGMVKKWWTSRRQLREATDFAYWIE